ncbi:hypothetical protein HID58_021353 [Brassica napus]|uniref:Uncharacterized protein n=1 Tax=Brassica napus TaxID=3708 RepID=A0ABQ8CW63_BRANA|nr:hypothetical protein HID58_021353 [Brassica napus]
MVRLWSIARVSNFGRRRRLTSSMGIVGTDAYEPTLVPDLPSDAMRKASSVESVEIQGLLRREWKKAWRMGQLGLGKGIIEALVPSALADGRVGNVGLPLDSFTNGYGGADHQNLDEAAGKKVAEAMRKENNMPIAWEPRLVEELRGVKVEDIACGSDHSLVLCYDGTLLSSGSNVYGQLGPICNVQSDSNTRRVVSSWGWNRIQQLGRGKPEELPRKVEGLDEETPDSVSAGRVHSLCVTEKGEAWVWGCGKNGRLGLGRSVDEPEQMLLEDVEGCVLQAGL